MFSTLNKKESMQTAMIVCKNLSGGAYNKILLTMQDVLAEWPDKLKTPSDIFM